MHPTNIKRSKRAQAALGKYVRMNDETLLEDIETGLVDLLADLRHFCDHAGLDFDKCAGMATGHYMDERTYNAFGVKEWRPPPE